MLEMKEQRISFSEALRPPEGYEVSYAVGTTYSLDLRALLGLCIPLGLGFEPEALESINPVSLFSALSKLQGRLAIYCDKGGIKADITTNQKTSGVLMLLEGMIHQVNVNWQRRDGLSSFHPKVWVVEYQTKKRGQPSLYRLMVLSRNLTFDTSWDVVATLEGRPGEPNECAEHVACFLEFLADGDTSTKTESCARRKDSHSVRIHRLAEAIRGVEFDVESGDFESVDFLPFGPQTKSEDNPKLLSAHDCELFTWRYRSMLVVSPFLSESYDAPLALMARNRSGESGKFVLLSREDSLAALSDEARAPYKCYCPVPSLSDVELDGEGGVDAAGYSNLHAKLYFAQDMSSRRTLWLGSLNASRNGTVNNVEALVRLGVRKHRLTFDKFLEPLIGSDKSNEKPPFVPFIPVDIQGVEDEGEREFQKAFRIASRLVSFHSAKVNIFEDGLASMDVKLDVRSIPKDYPDVSLTLSPLFRDDPQPVELGTCGHPEEIEFRNLRPDQVSALFVIRGTDGQGHKGECVTICPSERFDDAQLTLEQRKSLVIKAIMEADKGALAGYIAHAFDLPEGALAVNDGPEMRSRGLQGRSVAIPEGMYERLLNMAYSSPDAFSQASYLMDLIPSDVSDEQLDSLRELIATFRKAVKR